MEGDIYICHADVTPMQEVCIRTNRCEDVPVCSLTKLLKISDFDILSRQYEHLKSHFVTLLDSFISNYHIVECEGEERELFMELCTTSILSELAPTKLFHIIMALYSLPRVRNNPINNSVNTMFRQQLDNNNEEMCRAIHELTARMHSQQVYPRAEVVEAVKFLAYCNLFSKRTRTYNHQRDFSEFKSLVETCLHVYSAESHGNSVQYEEAMESISILVHNVVDAEFYSRYSVQISLVLFWRCVASMPTATKELGDLLSFVLTSWFLPDKDNLLLTNTTPNSLSIEAFTEITLTVLSLLEDTHVRPRKEAMKLWREDVEQVFAGKCDLSVFSELWIKQDGDVDVAVDEKATDLLTPYISDEEMSRVVALQEDLIYSGCAKPLGKGYLLAAYRFALVKNRGNVLKAIEQVAANPDSYSGLFPRPIKYLPLSTTPASLMKILSEWHRDRNISRNAASKPDYSDVIGATGWEIKNKTMRLLEESVQREEREDEREAERMREAADEQVSSDAKATVEAAPASAKASPKRPAAAAKKPPVKTGKKNHHAKERRQQKMDRAMNTSPGGG